MYIPLKFISKTDSIRICGEITHLGGRLTENRVLILSPKDQEVTMGKIILPGREDSIPNKGVIISVGEITDEYKTYRELMTIGKIVTYGRYAGKEIDFDPNVVHKEGDHKFTILSLNEILFIENNPNK